MHSYIMNVKIALNRRTPLRNNRRVDSVRHIPITYLPEKARIRNVRAYVRACAAVKPLNRSTGKLAEKFRIQYGRDTRIYGLPHCGSRDRIPRVEFSPKNSRYSRRISHGDRKKFANKISLSQKAAGNFAFNYFERTNLRSGSPHIYCTVRNRTRKSVPGAAWCDKKFSRQDRNGYFWSVYHTGNW